MLLPIVHKFSSRRTSSWFFVGTNLRYYIRLFSPQVKNIVVLWWPTYPQFVDLNQVLL
jgi:hypothetical protein